MHANTGHTQSDGPKDTQTRSSLPDFMAENRPLSLAEKLYVPAMARGLAMTFGRFMANFLFKRHIVTSSYPEQRREVSDRWRGRHRLTRRAEDGGLACVACKMCEMACPSHCITIVAEERTLPLVTSRQRIDKRPRSFTIDMARCIYCGLCVEACPEDAIRMDTGIIATVGYQRAEVCLDRNNLAKPPPPMHPLLHQDLRYPDDALLPRILRRYLGKDR